MTDHTMSELHSLPAWREWDEFIVRTPGAGFMQSSWWADHRQAAGQPSFGAIMRSGGSIMGGALVERRVLPCGSAFYRVSDGPVIPAGVRGAGDVWEAVLAMIDEHRRAEPVTISHLRIHPGWGSPPAFLHGFAAPAADDHLAEQQDGASVSLAGGEAALLGHMDACARSGIEARASSGVVVVEDPSPQGVADFTAMLGVHAFDTWPGASSPDSLTRLVPRLSAIGQGSLWFASEFGDRVAAALVVHFGSRTVAFHAGAVAPSPQEDACRILHFELMRQAIAAGRTAYEIRSGVPDPVAESQWPGFGQLRRTLGAVKEARMAVLDLVYDPMAYMQHMAFAAGESAVTGR